MNTPEKKQKIAKLKKQAKSAEVELQKFKVKVKELTELTSNMLASVNYLNLKLLSSAAFHATRTAGFIKLPSERTLRDCTHYFKSKVGFQLEVTQQLEKEVRIEYLPENRKFCALILDEMKIKETLIYYA